MAYDIRPLSFGEVLDRAFRVFLDNFMLLFEISAVVWIPSGILLASTSLIGNRVATSLNLIFLMVVGPILNAALIVAVAEVYLDRRVTIGEVFRAVRPIFLPLIGTYLLVGLLFAVPAIPTTLAFMVSPLLFALMLIVAIVIGGYFLVCWSLIGAVMIVERRFGMSALRRSRELVVGSWWRTFAILFTASLIANVPASALKFVWAFIPVIGAVLTAATQAVTGAYGMVALMIYYFDRRCRTEDFDLRLLAEQIRSEGPPTIATGPGSSSLA